MSKVYLSWLGSSLGAQHPQSSDPGIAPGITNDTITSSSTVCASVWTDCFLVRSSPGMCASSGDNKLRMRKVFTVGLSAHRSGLVLRYVTGVQSPLRLARENHADSGSTPCALTERRFLSLFSSPASYTSGICYDGLTDCFSCKHLLI